MKLLAFTDLHLSSNALKKIKLKIKKYKPELLVCAGDISIFGHGLSSVLKKLSRLGKKVLLVHGNHETGIAVKKLCQKYENLIFINKTFYKQDNYLFLGYGGSGFVLIENNFYKTGQKFRKIIKKNKSNKTIFVTHAPPYKTKLDLIVTSHCGNKTFRNFALKNRIDLYICGHLHENFGKEDRIKKTKIINPGPYGKIIEI